MFKARTILTRLKFGLCVCVCYVRSCIAHQATSVFHLLQQLAADSASPHWTLTRCKSSLNVAHYILHGLPLFVFCLGGIQFIAILGRHWFGMHRMWLIGHILCYLTVSSSLCCSLLYSISSFVTLSQYLTPTILCKQLCWNTLSFMQFLMSFSIFHFQNCWLWLDWA